MTTPSILHLEGLLTLLQMLANVGIEMESHQYDGVAFGNFALVLAKDHKKVRFIWDQKESVLKVEFQKVQNKAIAGIWEHDAFISVPSGAGVFPEIASNSEAMLLCAFKE